jgi:hypothetical protein
MAYKMKGFSGFKNSPAKQEGPIPKKNIKLQKGEMEGTWIYPGSDKGERIADYEDRAEFARSDAESSEGKEKKQHLANAKKLQHEADIIRNRKSPGKMYGKKSPVKGVKVKPREGSGSVKAKPPKKSILNNQKNVLQSESKNKLRHQVGYHKSVTGDKDYSIAPGSYTKEAKN